MSEEPTASELTGRLLLAVLTAAGSAGILLYLFCFCTPAGGAFPEGGPVWWKAVLGNLFLSVDPGILSWPLSAVLILSGFVAVNSFAKLVGRLASSSAH